MFDLMTDMLAPVRPGQQFEYRGKTYQCLKPCTVKINADEVVNAAFAIEVDVALPSPVMLVPVVLPAPDDDDTKEPT